MTERTAARVTSAHNAVMLAVLLGAGLTGSMFTPAPVSDTLAQGAPAPHLVDRRANARATQSDCVLNFRDQWWTFFAA